MSAKCPACGERIWVPFPHEQAAAAESPVPLASAPQQEAGAFEEVDDVEPAADEVGDDAWVDDAPGASSKGSSRRSCPACAAEVERDDVECEHCGAVLKRPKRRNARRAALLEQQGEVDPQKLEIGQMMSDAWEIYSKDLAVLLFGPFLLGLALSAGAIPLLICGMLTGPFIILIAPPIIWLLSALTAIGTNTLFFKAARGDKPEIGDAFAGFGQGNAYLGAFFVFFLLMSFLSVLLFLLLIIPGLFLAAIAWLMPRALMDERLSATGAISRGWEIAKSNLGTVLLVALINVGVGIAAAFVPFGMLFAQPYMGMFCTVAYLRLTGQSLAKDFAE
jgi:hypothetical protein